MKKVLFIILFIGCLVGGNAQTWDIHGNELCVPPPGQLIPIYAIGTQTPGGITNCAYGEILDFRIIRGGRAMIKFKSGLVVLAPPPFGAQSIPTKVLIGDPQTTTTPGNYKLYVETGIMTEKVKVALKNSADWADYVFKPDYNLMPLEELEIFIRKNGHLPNVPSAEKLIENGGIELGAMQAKQMAKIEELTLHLIQKDKEIEALQKQVALLSKQMKLLLEKE